MHRWPAGKGRKSVGNQSKGKQWGELGLGPSEVLPGWVSKALRVHGPLKPSDQN